MHCWSCALLLYSVHTQVQMFRCGDSQVPVGVFFLQSRQPLFSLFLDLFLSSASVKKKLFPRLNCRRSHWWLSVIQNSSSSSVEPSLTREDIGTLSPLSLLSIHFTMHTHTHTHAHTHTERKPSKHKRWTRRKNCCLKLFDLSLSLECMQKVENGRKLFLY
jgi:hypothetical protein